MTKDATAKIRELNDQTRQQVMMPTFGRTVPCAIYMTQAVGTLAPEAQIEIAAMVRNFDNFTPDNDPYKEHDFGSFKFQGETINWKIDYYANDSMTHGSEDPADPEKTFRVLTIMLASDY